jgi:hypothetical protein
MDDLDLSDSFSDASDLADVGGDSADIDSGAFFNFTDVDTDDTAFSSFDGLSTTQDLVNGDYTVQGVPVSDAPFDSTQAALVNGQTTPISTDDAIGSLDTSDSEDDAPYDDTQPNPQEISRANPGALAQAGASVAKAASTASSSSGSIASSADAISSLVKGTAAVAADVLSVTKAVQSAVNGKVNVKPASAMNVGTGSVSPAGTNGVQTMSPITIALVCGGVLLLAMAAKHG